MSETLPEFTRETLTWISKRTISAGLPRTHHYELQDRLSRIIAGYALYAPDDGWLADVNDGYKALCEAAIHVDPRDAYARAWEAAKQDGLHKPPLPMPHELDMERIVKALELMAAPEEQRQENGADDAESPKQTTSKLASALAVLTEHPDWTNKQIAQRVACNPKYLSQAKKFQAARKALRGTGQESQRRARKHRGNDMDAYERVDRDDET